ncbi:MAG: IS1634 family transposase [Verrucomicrobiota bacterium]|jgi:transposase|nr:IS1634 family transposase [Verrucomicrobiota bacterium]|tara:strand:+ start:104 stop:1756 length:1653 start_codon:yes stop_codon:yes gene_type:complete
MFVRAKKRGNRTYLMIVKNERVNGKVKQTVLHSLGRLDVLQKNGELDALLMSAQRFSEQSAVLNAHAQGESITTRTYAVGPSLVFEKLWKKLDVGACLSELLEERNFEFDVERAIFLTVLHRLFESGSDRQAIRWKDEQSVEGTDDLQLHHFYRAMAWLGQELPEQEQAGATPFSPRCVKDKIEEALFARNMDLFTTLDMVFFDTTSIYFEGEGGEALGQYGHSKDHRPDLKQMVVGMVLDNEGRPVCSEMWPGNTTDVKTLLPIVERLRTRFHIGTVCIVADRGMISQDTIQTLEKTEGVDYILGVRMRNSKEAKQEVLSRGGRYREVYPKSADPKAPSPLKVKEVRVGGRRYIVCHNEDQAAKDAADRDAIVKSLEDQLKGGDKKFVGNKGFRKFLKSAGKAHFEVDYDKAREEERYDGKWVLRTSTQLSAKDAALKYKQLWMVEDIFRTTKSMLDTRPIWHKCDETIRGHVFCSYLALALRVALRERLEAKGWKLEWSDVIRDLGQLLEVAITVQGKGYVIRTETKGVAGKVAQACGVALPPTLRNT